MMKPPRDKFGTLDTIHLHCDAGASKRSELEQLVRVLEAAGFPSTLDAVNSFVAGPQRIRLPEVYASHTPGTDREDFGLFSTSLIGRERATAITAAELLLRELAAAGVSGVSVELEWVVAEITTAGRWREVPYGRVGNVRRDELDYRLAPSYPVEIHQSIYLPKSALPINLAKLLAISTVIGVEVGGWFDFSDDQWWAYSSNTFCRLGEAESIAKDQNLALRRRILETLGQRFYLRTLVEAVLGIWKTPLEQH